jgi:hypothetical protein
MIECQYPMPEVLVPSLNSPVVVPPRVPLGDKLLALEGLHELEHLDGGYAFMVRTRRIVSYFLTAIWENHFGDKNSS